jgi:MSHA biogenesis protein MshQ
LQITNYLKCTGYNFSIPAGATIDGIAVAVEAHSRRTMNDYAVQLVKTGVIQATNYATNTRFPNPDAYTTYGSAADLWGNAWTAADINSANFGVAFAAQRGNFASSDTAYVDHMPITVTYTLPANVVLSINRAGADPTTAASVSWTVTFGTSVSGVSSSNFTLVNTGLGGAPAITAVTGSGTAWTVTASTGTGTGTLGLDMTNTTGVSPAMTNLPFAGQVYSVRPPTPVVYYHDTTNGVNIGFDGPTNVQSGTNVTIPPIITASLTTSNTCTGNARSRNHPAGLYTHSRWYLTTDYAVDTDIGANPSGSARLRGRRTTDTVIVSLYDYDPVSGAKTLIGSSPAITLTGGGTTTAYPYTISSALYTVPAGHRLMLEYNFNQSATGDNARVYCSAADSYIAVMETASPPPLAEYRMDGAGWSGTAGEVVDSSGNGNNAQAFNSANTDGTTPAIAGSPGTCRYGVFDNGGTITQGYVELPGGFPNLNTDFSVTAWVRTTNNAVSGQRILIDDQSNTGGFGFSLGDGGAGRLRLYSRSISPVILDSAYTIANNTWYFVAVVVDITNKRRTIYVYDAAGALLNSTSDAAAFTGSWGTDAGPVSIGGETNASGESPASFHFRGNLDEVRIYQRALNQAAVSAIAKRTRVCAVIVPTPGGFNAYETSTAAGSITGVIKTKVAGSTVSVDAVALNPAKTGILTSFADTVRVEVLDSSNNAGALDANNCRSTWTTIQTLSPDPAFITSDNGRKTITFTVPDAYRDARLRITYPAGAPTTTGCSTDNFAIRPNAFTAFSVSDADWQTAGTARTLNDVTFGAITHKAGRPFSVRASAVNAAGTPAVTANYTGAPTATLSACAGAACTATFGTLSLNTTFVSGQLTSDVATYDNVGALSLQLVDSSFASVDSTDSTALERNITSPVINAGRFVPDHFAVSLNTPTFTTACGAGSFTYVGQAFGYSIQPVITVQAQNFANATTTLYTGSWWRLTNASLTGKSYTAASGTFDASGAPGTDPVIADAGMGSGTLTFSSGTGFLFTRTTPVLPFNAETSLAINVIDADSVAYAGNPASFGTASAGNGMGFTSGKEMRFGRLRAVNANGSQLLPLQMVMQTQYWGSTGGGNSFITNTADSCTGFVAANIALGNYQKNLNACETSITVNSFTGGRSTLRLSAPGNGNNGSVDLTANLGTSGSGTTCIAGIASAVTGANRAYLQGNWTGGAYDQNPTVRAAFGVNRGTEEVVHTLENY